MNLVPHLFIGIWYFTMPVMTDSSVSDDDQRNFNYDYEAPASRLADSSDDGSVGLRSTRSFPDAAPIWPGSVSASRGNDQADALLDRNIRHSSSSIENPHGAVKWSKRQSADDESAPVGSSHERYFYDDSYRMGTPHSRFSRGRFFGPEKKRGFAITLELASPKSPPVRNRYEVDPATLHRLPEFKSLSHWVKPKSNPVKRIADADPGEFSETGLTLSITSPLEVLREKIRIDNERMKQRNLNRKNRFSANRYLKDLGRRRR